MSNKAVTTKRDGASILKDFEPRKDVKRLADAVIDRKVITAEALTQECVGIAHEYYVEIIDVYRAVWDRVKRSKKLHATHPAGKTEAYHTLQERAER